MKGKILKQVLATTVLASTLLITNAGISNAALQANPNTQYTKTDTHTNWMKSFRQMETAGGAMGLNETLDSDLTSTESNGIDVHMMKATEYGAIAILSASGYGNSSNDNAIITTTGNNTGMILNTNYWENVAGGVSGSIFSGVDSRYFDSYTVSDPTSAKVGDALGTSSTTNPGCAGWHSISSTKAIWVTTNGNCFFRGGSGIFSFVNQYFGGNNAANIVLNRYCRGVAVCGEGL